MPYNAFFREIKGKVGNGHSRSCGIQSVALDLSLTLSYFLLRLSLSLYSSPSLPLPSPVFFLHPLVLPPTPSPFPSPLLDACKFVLALRHLTIISARGSNSF